MDPEISQSHTPLNNFLLPPSSRPPAIPDRRRPPKTDSIPLRYSRDFLLAFSSIRKIPENLNRDVLEYILSHTIPNQNRQSYSLEDQETTRQQLERQAEQYDRLRRAAPLNPPTTPRSGWIDALASVERSAMSRRLRSDHHREPTIPADVAAARADAAAALGGLRRGSGEKLQQYCRQYVANKGHCPKGDTCRYIHAWPVADISLGFDSLNGNYGLDHVQQRDREREHVTLAAPSIRHITLSDIVEPYGTNNANTSVRSGSSSGPFTPTTPTSPSSNTDVVTVDASLMSAVTDTLHSLDDLVDKLRWQQAHTECELDGVLRENEALRHDIRVLLGETGVGGGGSGGANNVEDLKHLKRRSFIF